MEKYIITQLKTIKDIKKSFNLRKIIFCKEYGVNPKEEIDLYDNISIHFGCFHNNKLIGSCRIIICGDSAIFGRLCVLRKFRKLGIGKLLMLHRENYCKSNRVRRVFLTSTTPAFHEKLGYVKTGKTIVDTGIETKEMKKELI